MAARFSLSLAVLLGLLVTGCTRNQKPAPSQDPATDLAAPASAPSAVRQQPTPAPSAEADTRPVLVTFGDSLSAGYGVDPGYSYPDFLQQEVDRRNLAWHVVNAGISGDTTSGGVARLDQVIALRPKVVVLELGGNDGLRGVPVSQMKANLETMITRLQAAGAQVVLAGMTLPRNYGPEYVKAFEQAYVELANKHKLVRIPFLLEGVYNVRGMMQDDGIHATSQGNKKVAELVIRYLEPVLRG